MPPKKASTAKASKPKAKTPKTSVKKEPPKAHGVYGKVNPSPHHAMTRSNTDDNTVTAVFTFMVLNCKSSDKKDKPEPRVLLIKEHYDKWGIPGGIIDQSVDPSVDTDVHMAKRFKWATGYEWPKESEIVFSQVQQYGRVKIYFVALKDCPTMKLDTKNIKDRPEDTMPKELKAKPIEEFMKDIENPEATSTLAYRSVFVNMISALKTTIQDFLEKAKTSVASMS